MSVPMRLLLLALAALPLAVSAAAASSPSAEPSPTWRPARLEAAVLDASPRLRERADRVRVAALDGAAIDEQLARAPRPLDAWDLERQPVVALPLPEGGFGRYRVEQVDTMEPALAARFPSIRSYRLTATDGSGAIGRMTRTPRGVSASILDAGRTLRVEPLASAADGRHLAYVESDLLDDSAAFCAVSGEPVKSFERRFGNGDAPKPHLANGDTLRTYRMAVATTGEFHAARGGTDESVLAAIVVDLDKVNLRYGQELAIAFTLIDETTDLFYTDPMTDPYTDGTPCTMRGEAQVDIPAVIGEDAFDIGHVFGAVVGGGCAGGSNVCTAAKANGATTFRTDSMHPAGHEDFGGYRLIMHEVGHQFGAGHTWNATNVGSCTPGQYSMGSAYEPSSGTTIMSYSGTCGAQNIRTGPADPYFHTFSYDQVVTFSTTGAGDDCADATPSGNSAPTVDAGPDYTIPRGTPFTLSGSADDPDGHSLTFAWEQVDQAVAPLPANTDDGTGPLFRSFPPTPDGNVRTFPQWPVVLGDLPQQIGETLPTTDRTMTFRLVARDDQPVGGVEYDTTVITTSGSFFAVTAPSSFDSFGAGCTATVDWAVGSADEHADELRILFSDDGGQTFDTELAVVDVDAAPVEVVLPCVATDQARIKVEAVGNVFFDVNPGAFEVTADPPTIDLAASDAPVGPDCSATVAFEATIEDDCGVDPDAVAVTASLVGGSAVVGDVAFDVAPAGPLGLVVTGTVPVSDLVGCPAEVEIEVFTLDGCGFAAAVEQVALVSDQTPPTLLGVPANAVVECDEVPPPAMVTAEDGCDDAPEVSLSETETPGDCPGNYELLREWTATDACGNEASAAQTLTVQDTTPPSVMPSEALAACLWPPNHQMHCFGQDAVAPVIADACSEPVTWRYVGCASDQPADGPGDGDTEPDCVVAEDGLSVCVRAERAGGDLDGRTYSLAIEATDACGNVSPAVVVGTVHVPHSQANACD